MSALERAADAVLVGLSWERPCLIWVADYVLDVTGVDHAADWRAIRWNERRAMSELRRLAIGGQGETMVARAMDVAWTMRAGFADADACQQGAVLIGVFNDLAENGSPAIFDGESRWILGMMGGGLLTTGVFPDRAWEVKW